MDENHEKAIQALHESKPPATDTFTYLTIIQKFVCPEILPTLHEILQDAQICQDIGWDLVSTLVPIEGSEPCLETIARLGNPREVIIMIQGTLGSTEYSDEADLDPSMISRFVTLLRMLEVLHKRIKVKAPSRFVQSTLQTVYSAYNAKSPEMTVAVISLVRSLSGERRPLPPTRTSSTNIKAPPRENDPSKNAPDPEADQSDVANPSEAGLVTKLLQSFLTCIIEAYVNVNYLDWPIRLLEFYHPDKLVPGKVPRMRAFKEDEWLQAQDALIGQLVVWRLPECFFTRSCSDLNIGTGR
jgi:hypothetical protein